MTNIEIRECTGNDAESIFHFIPKLSPLTQHTLYTYWNVLTHFGDSCFVAESEGQPVGYISSHPTLRPKNEWFIWQLGILPEHRGHGLAGELQNKVVESAITSGAFALRTSIESDNGYSLGSFTKLAHRLGVDMEQIDEIYLPSDDDRVIPEILYRIPLPQN